MSPLLPRRIVRRWMADLTVAALAAMSVGAVAPPAGPADAAPGQPGKPGPGLQIRTEVHHDTSAPLRTLASKPAPTTGAGADVGALDPGTGSPPARPDPVVQSSTPNRPGGAADPSIGINRDGLGEGFSGPQGTFVNQFIPPDPNLAVGKSQVVQMVNVSFAIFDKATGNVVFGPAAVNTLFAGFGGACETTNRGDPIVRYDGFSDRWILSQFAFVDRDNGPYFECVAVSVTPDATGQYHRYAFQYADFPDYPKVSVWPDAYYVTYNLFDLNGISATFLGAETCALDRVAMLGGTPATQQCFKTGPAHDGLLAADAGGAEPPPFGAPNIHIALSNTGSALLYWKFHVDWDNPANTTFTGPTTLPVAGYTEACLNAPFFFRACVPQPGSNVPGSRNFLATLSDRAMFRLAYRNFGSHESLVVNHSVVAGSSVGVRWYELRLSGGNPVVHQQSTYAPDDTYRWMGSIAMDRAGNMALGYSVSSLSVFPGVRITGRLAGDPLNTMTQGETTLAAGNGVQVFFNAPHRWGDYSSMDVDPVDGCTFWYTNEYIPFTPAISSINWRTRISSFTLPGCVGTDRRFATVSSSSFDGEPVPTGTFLTLYTSVPVTDEAQGLPFPWPDRTPGGLSVRTNTCGLNNGAGRLPILFVGPAFGGTQINLYYPNDYVGGENTEPFGACPTPRLTELTLEPKPGFGGPIRTPVALTIARPGMFLDFSSPNTPAGYHYNPSTQAQTTFAECNADTTGTKCPVSTGGNANYLILFTGGAERFGCPDFRIACTPQLSGIAFSLAPPGGGFVQQPLDFFGWAGFIGQEQANVRILPDTSPGPNRLRVTVPNTFPQSTQELTVRLGAAD
jgi:hypothetical protein